MANCKPPDKVEISLYKLIFHPISGEEPSSVFSDAAQVVSHDATELCIVGPYLGGAVLRPLVEGRKFRLVTDLEACFGASIDEAVVSLLSDHLDSIKNKAGVHAKLVCSSKAALFGSANFTRHGFASRDELGCLIRDPQFLLILQQWFEELWLTSDSVDAKTLSLVAKQAKEGAVARQVLGIATEKPARRVGSRNLGWMNRLPRLSDKAEQQRTDRGQYWWFGVNNGKHGHIRLLDIRPFMIGQEPEFSWPIGNSKPKALYGNMKAGDRVLLWTGHGNDPEWGFIGTATISAQHHDRVIFGKARRFSTALTPYPKKHPQETDVIRSLERIFGRDYPPLGDVMRAVFGTRRRHPITVHEMTKNAFEEVTKLVQAPHNAQ